MGNIWTLWTNFTLIWEAIECPIWRIWPQQMINSLVLTSLIMILRSWRSCRSCWGLKHLCWLIIVFRGLPRSLLLFVLSWRIWYFRVIGWLSCLSWIICLRHWNDWFVWTMLLLICLIIELMLCFAFLSLKCLTTKK